MQGTVLRILIEGGYFALGMHLIHKPILQPFQLSIDKSMFT